MLSLLIALALGQSPSPRQTDITLSVGCGRKANEVVLTILNPGPTDTAVLLGYAIGNGQRYLPRELIVEIKRDAGADFEQLLYDGPRGILGGIDHWIVTLPASASFVLPLRATEFAANAAGFRTLTGPPEELRVRLVGQVIASDLSADMARMKLWNLWTGTAVSNSLKVAECGRN